MALPLPAPDRTALVISHRPVGLAGCDRILFLQDGRFSTIAPGEFGSFADAMPGWAPAGATR